MMEIWYYFAGLIAGVIVFDRLLDYLTAKQKEQGN